MAINFMQKTTGILMARGLVPVNDLNDLQETGIYYTGGLTISNLPDVGQYRYIEVIKNGGLITQRIFDSLNKKIAYREYYGNPGEWKPWIYDYGESGSTASSIIGTQSGLESVQSASFQKLTGLSQTITTKKASSTVLAFVSIGGLYTSNTGYDISFDLKMDNTTYSSSGAKRTNAGDWRANMATDGSKKIRFNEVYIFNNVPKGQHTFDIYWNSGSDSVVAYTGNYATRNMTLVEI